MDEVASINRWIRILGFFYGISLFVSVLLNYTTRFRSFGWQVFTQVSLGLLAAGFIAVLWSDLKKLFSGNGFSLAKAAVYSGAAVLASLLVNLAVHWANRLFFHHHIVIYERFLNLQYPTLGMITLLVILPAFFEEIAYRGVVLGSLLPLAEPRRAILLSAVLFAIVHMSFISFFWLVPFSVWLGNVRYREGTIWYGVLIHLFFNLTACLSEFIL